MKKVLLIFACLLSLAACSQQKLVFEKFEVPGLEPKPDFWRVRPDEIIDLCKNVKKGHSEVIATTPAGLPVYAVFYGDFSEPAPQTNWSAGNSSTSVGSYLGNVEHKQTILYLAGVHGSEPENVAASMNLIQMLETGKPWAKKMFPDLSKSKAIEKLWEAILFTARVTDDPVAAWEAHNKDLHDRCAYLNSLGIDKLIYKGTNGTDFTVGMIPEAEFKGGVRGVADGIVYATKPLSYQGQLIEDFSVRFENGKAVEVHAARNEELLKKMISMDEGAAYLGECALVPVNSPISESGLLFYETLFDENAACHLALGAGFADTIKGFENKTLDECRKLGINESMIHVDFMIGFEGLDIDAQTRDGKTVPIFRSGKWAF